MKKFITLTAAAIVLTTALTGCGAKKSSSNDDKVIKVAASETPHAEILNEAKPLLKEKGYDLQVTVFQDYVLPNEVVNSGEFDANYFQHVPFLEDYDEQNKADLVAAGKIHYEPFGIYPGKKNDLDKLEKGDVIAIPNDNTNEGRALLLLQDRGLIKLKDGAGMEATIQDIAENPIGIEFRELAAEQVARVKDEVAFIVLNGNYALTAGLSVAKDSVYYEQSDSEAAKTYVNIIAVKAENEKSEKIQALVDVLKSDEIKEFIEKKYDGAVLVYEE